MKRRLQWGLTILFCVISFGFFAAFNFVKPRILILQSYHIDYPWTRDVNIGIERVLGKRTDYSIRWHYMDTKRNPSAHFMKNAGIHAIRKINDWKPAVVIAIDDDAQEYAAKEFVNKSGISIVFSGVNGGVEHYGYMGATNVTGLYERKALAPFLDLVNDLAQHNGIKKPIRILALGDMSYSVRQDLEFMEAFDWGATRFAGKLVDTFPEWKNAVEEARGQADFIVILNYRKVHRSGEDKSLVPPREVVDWTEDNSAVALIGQNGFYVEEGGMLAIATSPYEQGEEACRLAVEIIDKQLAANQIPFRTSRQFAVYARESRLQRRGFKLTQICEAFARATSNYY